MLRCRHAIDLWGPRLRASVPLIAAVLLSLSPPALGQSADWQPIPCAESYIAMDGGMTCLIHAPGRAPGSGMRAVSSGYAVNGTVAGTVVTFFLNWPIGGTYIAPYTTAQAATALKGIDATTRERGANWSEPRSFGDTVFMTFQADARNCAAINQAGPLKGYGYAWSLMGYACSEAAIPQSDAYVKAILAALRVGPPEANQSALGTPVTAFSRPQ